MPFEPITRITTGLRPHFGARKDIPLLSGRTETCSNVCSDCGGDPIKAIRRKPAWEPRGSALARALLLALAWSQVAFAAHQFDCDDLTHDDECDVCGILERIDDDETVPVVFAETTAPPNNLPESIKDNVSPPTGPISAYNARASP